MLYSYYLKTLLYTIGKCTVGRYIFIMIFNCLRILTRAFVYISYFDAARWRADTEITPKSSSAASILLSSMVRVLLRAIQQQSHRRPRSTGRPCSNRQRQLPHPSRRNGSSGEIAQEGEVSRSRQRPNGAGAGRGRSHDKRPTDYL